MHLFYWESDEKWHAEPEFNQDVMIKGIASVASELEGKKGDEVIQMLLGDQEYDKVWLEIRTRVAYLAEKNAEKMKEYGEDGPHILGAAAYLEGIIVGMVLAQ